MHKLEYPGESFMDLAKRCVRKRNKGLFDQLITFVYRLKQLTLALEKLDDVPLDEKKLFIYIVTKGLKFNNFEDFKNELIQNPSFSFLAECEKYGDAFKHLTHLAKQQGLTIDKMFLTLLKDSMTDHYRALNFLKSYVSDQIEVYEDKLKKLESP